MSEVDYRFKYDKNLIGQEIIHRGLTQQKKFEGEGKFGMTWNGGDQNALAQALAQGDTIKSSDFDVPDGFPRCEFNPPCPWDKSGDDNLDEADLMPIIVPTDRDASYQFEIFGRRDSADEKSYDVLSSVASYAVNQSRLPADKRDGFTFFEHGGVSRDHSTVIFIVKRFEGSSLQSTFTYFFNLV